MMVKWADDGLLQANEMLVNDGEMSAWSYIHFTIIDEQSTIINKQITIITEHFTIINEYFTIIAE